MLTHQHDNKTKKILQLAIPYTLTAMFEGISNILTVAVLGKVLRMAELLAYIAAHFAISVTKLWLQGPLDSLTTLCSQAIGAEERKLAGKYVQIAVVYHRFSTFHEWCFGHSSWKTSSFGSALMK